MRVSKNSSDHSDLIDYSKRVEKGESSITGFDTDSVILYNPEI